MAEYPAKSYFSPDRINISTLLSDTFFGKVIKRENSFLLFENSNGGYTYFKDYGGIAFVNISTSEREKSLSHLSEKHQIKISEFTDEIQLIKGANEETGGFGELYVDTLSNDLVHLICLNLAQSAALFYYQSISEQLLTDTKKHTSEMERKGKVSLRKKRLLKYIGSSLNLKNKISENLYVFESPMLAYSDEEMSDIDNHLNEDLEIKIRYNAIKEQLNIIQENLDLFKDLSMHQHSSFLEWIIILLILIEVVHMIVDQLSKL